jgi:uncharacterized protein YcfJ
MKVKVPLAAVVLAAACGAALATEYGTVLSSTPVTAQVAVAQQQCSDQQVLVQPATSGGGALLGALVGGAIGNSVGSGFGRAAATGLGVVAGSVIGERAEAANTPPAAVPVRSCQSVSGYQSRIVGYDVVYDYNGQRYSARVAQDPGQRIALSVAPAAATMGTPVPAAAGPGAVPAAVYAAAPAPAYYVPYAPYGYYGYGVYPYLEPAIVVGARIGFAGHARHYR